MGTLFSIGLKVISNIVRRNIYFMTLNTGSLKDVLVVIGLKVPLLNRKFGKTTAVPPSCETHLADNIILRSQQHLPVLHMEIVGEL